MSKALNHSDILHHFLKPVVRLCVRRSIRLGEVIEAVKRLFVTVAAEEITRRGDVISASRVSVITGVHRKDVSLFLNRKENGSGEPKSLIAKIIGEWQQDSRFVTRSGAARVLTVEGKHSEFSELVAAVSVDLNPYTVLYELERIGAVERSRKGVKLLSRIYNPVGDVAEGLRLLATDTEDLMEAVQENLFEPREIPNLHIRTEYDNIPACNIDEARGWLVREGSQLHKRARDYFASLDRDNSDRTVGGGRVRVVLGSFGRIERISVVKTKREENL